LVFSYTNKFQDVLLLSIISIWAVTLWAYINYYLWYYLFKNDKISQNKIDYKSLLVSMIHINTIALYIFDQWQKQAPKKIIYLTWLLNLPYYILIIWVTYLLKNQILNISENSYLLFVILFLWLWYSIFKNKKLTD
jgi:membrane-associated protein